MRPLFDSLHFFDDREPHSAALNMAIDEVLLRQITAPMLRVYCWAAPAVSFGYFEKWEPVQKAHPHREPVRRWTGGGVVLHGEDWTYSLLVPRTCALAQTGATESYRAIHECIASALCAQQISGSISKKTDAKTSQACFENAVLHDVLLDGKKIAGAAQRRTLYGLLHQGSIQGVKLPECFGAALAKHFAARIEIASLPNFANAAASLAAAKYAQREWLMKIQ